MVGWKTPGGEDFGVVLGKQGKDLLCLTIYDKALRNDVQLKHYRDEELTGQLAKKAPLPGLSMDVQRVPSNRAYKTGRLVGPALRPYLAAAAGLQVETQEDAMEPLAILEDIRQIFGPVLIDPDAPWDGTLKEWHEYFERKLDLDDLDEERPERSGAVAVSLIGPQTEKRIRLARGGAKAKAHRAFIKMVRKDPAAHRQKMRNDRMYRRKHKAHDALMRKTARKGFRRIRSSVEGVLSDEQRQRMIDALGERDPGQAFMDLPFELRVTEKELSDKERSSAAAAATKKAGMPVPTHYMKTCSMDSFYKNVQYFYRVKGKEWEGSKKEKLQRAIAASYSVLKRSCGVTSKGRMTPSQIVAKGESVDEAAKPQGPRARLNQVVKKVGGGKKGSKISWRWGVSRLKKIQAALKALGWTFESEHEGYGKVGDYYYWNYTAEGGFEATLIRMVSTKGPVLILEVKGPSKPRKFDPGTYVHYD
jgi:hypothetical protein